jgi:CheY-like chemotaxis protein
MIARTAEIHAREEPGIASTGVDGFHYITAINGKEGVKAAVADKPDLILMNGKMPEMDGWQATRLLRANPETKKIPILAATAMFQPIGDSKVY